MKKLLQNSKFNQISDENIGKSSNIFMIFPFAIRLRIGILIRMLFMEPDPGELIPHGSDRIRIQNTALLFGQFPDGGEFSSYPD